MHGIDSSKHEILRTSVFRHIFRHPLEDPEAGWYMLYQHLHGDLMEGTNITTLYVPIYDQDHWHFIMVSIYPEQVIHSLQL